MSGLTVGVVGATGLVGQELLRILEEREFPVGFLRLAASDRSVGQTVSWRAEPIPVEQADPRALSDLDLLFLCAEAEVSRALVPALKGRVGLILDNSSAFRLDPEVPLVVPEVNPEAIEGHPGLIANPNCSTVQMLLAVAPLEEALGVDWVGVATYQSASGAGKSALDELMAGHPPSRFPEEGDASLSLPYNLIPRIGPEDETGYSEEERKLIEESRKILARPSLPVYPTAVRVPTFRSHAQALTVGTVERVTAEVARAVLARAEGVKLEDEPDLPTPRGTAGRDPVYVSRLRVPPGNDRILQVWTVADNLRKGAALNAVQIAEVALGLASPVSAGSPAGRAGR